MRRDDPEDYVAQETVRLSTHPTWCDGSLEPRHIDLRAFAYRRRDRPGGLTRVALEGGSLIVNSTQDGGAKDTWVLWRSLASMATRAGRGGRGRRPPRRARSTAGGWSPRRCGAARSARLFTLSGGHLFSIYDGCKAEGIEVVDFRHEQSAAFAAIGWAKATREPGICALTAGCGVTNGMSAIASAQADGVPLVTLGGRAPEMRWGRGSLQEIDHLPFVEAAGQVRRDRQGPAEDRPRHRGGDRPRDRAAARPDLRRLPAGRRLLGGRGGGPRRPRRSPTAPPTAWRRRRAPRRGGAAGDHGRHQPLLGPGRGGAARAGRGARDPGLPQRLGRGCLPPDHELYFSRPAAPGSGAATSPW